MAMASSAKAQALHDRLVEQVGRLTTSDEWTAALDVLGRFHHYSFGNGLLIQIQRPDATLVAGYRRWQELGRQVRKGERGIAILAPMLRTATDDDGEKYRYLTGFRVVHVFDVSQTDGDDLGLRVLYPDELGGDAPSTGPVEKLLAEAGFAYEIGDPCVPGAKGVTDWRTRTITLAAGLEPAQALKTAVHELAHVLLHEPDDDDRPGCRGVVEVEAESVAYVVCSALGVETGDYSFAYVAQWAARTDDGLAALQATGERVRRCADEVLRALAV